MPLLLPPISWDALWMSKSSVPAKLHALDCCSALFADLASEASVFEVFVLLIKNMYQGSTRDDIIKNTSRSLRLLQEFWIQKTFFCARKYSDGVCLDFEKQNTRISTVRVHWFSSNSRNILVQAALQLAETPNSFTRKSDVMLFSRLRLNRISILIDKYD